MFPDEDNCSIDSSNDFDNDAGTGLVQLGYVEDENNSEIEKKNNCSRLKFPNWKKWDGGKAGGFPVTKYLTRSYSSISCSTLKKDDIIPILHFRNRFGLFRPIFPSQRGSNAIFVLNK